MFKKTLPLFLLLILTATSVFSQNSADSGYYYQKIGFKEKAASFFEEYIYANPDSYQVRMDLAYTYRDMGQTTKAKEQFEYVSKNSTDANFVEQANFALAEINKTQTTTTTQNNAINYSVGSGDSGYYYYNQGNKKLAATHFELHLKDKPRDVKVRLQLANIYYSQGKYSRALKHYDVAGRYATDAHDKEIAKSSSYVLRDEIAGSSPRSIDIYFYNYYDSFQENYIANLVGHVNFRIGPGFYAGPYLDVYTDSRSSKALIFNDRFVEIGLFLRYYIMKNLFFEGRLGFTRQLDLDSNKINIKPMLVYFNRFGDAKVYVSKGSSTPKTSLYLDIYYAAMYDYKYKNAFLQASFQEVLRFHTGGYSYVENYLVQNLQFDGRKLDYNNYFEVGAGVRFKPNVMIFPIIFLEPTYKVYFYGDRKASFQIKAGFYFNFRSKI
jgi:tetratricopeptide (TPR) repeat protein